MVAPVVASVTRESMAPGVQAGSGSPPRLTQAVVLVRGAGVQAATISVGTGTSVMTPTSGTIAGSVGGSVDTGASGSVLDVCARVAAGEQTPTINAAVRMT